MSGWEERARIASRALQAAISQTAVVAIPKAPVFMSPAPDGASPVTDAMRTMREFRAHSSAVPDEDRDRHAAYADVLASGIKALQLIERSRRIMEITGDPTDGAHAAGAGLMIGRTILGPVARALNALMAGRREEPAESAVRRLSNEALAPAIGRVNYLYKLAAKEGIAAAPDDDLEDGE